MKIIPQAEDFAEFIGELFWLNPIKFTVLFIAALTLSLVVIAYA